MADLYPQPITAENQVVADHISNPLLPFADSELPSYESLADQQGIIQPQTIHVDGVLIFPSRPPANALYQLSRDLIAGTRISIERIDHEIHTPSNSIPRLRVKDRLLYNISHQMFDDSSIEIVGRRKECFSSILMAKTSSFTEQSWTLCALPISRSGINQKVLECGRNKTWSFRNSNQSYEWRNAQGRLIAVEEGFYEPGLKRVSIANPSLKILEPLEQKMVDLLITAWCAHIWNRNLKATGQIRTIMKGKNANFKQ